MIGKGIKNLKKKYGFKAQAIVEFAIALPILLALVIGIFEVARVIFIYSSVTNASRNASRYASAVGYEDTGTYHKFIYCDGIKSIAQKSAYLMNPSDLTITISYDEGPGTGSLGNCTKTGGDDTTMGSLIEYGDRVTVKVVANYKPMLKLIPISSRNITSTSSRTILGIVSLKSYP